MLNVGRLNEGVVLDHIKAGKSMMIYHDLKWTAVLQLSRMQEVKKWDAKTLLKSSARSTALTLIFLDLLTIRLLSIL